MSINRPMTESLVKTDPERTISYSQTRVSIQYDSSCPAEDVAREILDGSAGYAYGMTPVSFTIREVKTLRWSRVPRAFRKSDSL